MIIRSVIRFRFIICVGIRFGRMVLVLCRSLLCLVLVVPRLLRVIRFLVTRRALIFLRGRLMVWRVSLVGLLMIGSDLMLVVLRLVSRLMNSCVLRRSLMWLKLLSRWL